MNFSETDIALLYEYNVYYLRIFICLKMVYEYLKLDFLAIICHSLIRVGGALHSDLNNYAFKT